MSTIIMDVDGVLADFVLAYTRQAVEMGFLDKENSCFDQVGWDQFGLTSEQMSKVWDVIYDIHGWWASLDALVSRSVFSEINKLQFYHQVVFVSARQGINPQFDTTNWLDMHGVENASVVITKKKGEVARALNADYSLEDKPENAAVIHWLADAKPCKSYIIDKLYNQVEYLPKNVKRVKTVEEFLGEID